MLNRWRQQSKDVCDPKQNKHDHAARQEDLGQEEEDHQRMEGLLKRRKRKRKRKRKKRKKENLCGSQWKRRDLISGQKVCGERE